MHQGDGFKSHISHPVLAAFVRVRFHVQITLPIEGFTALRHRSWDSPLKMGMEGMVFDVVQAHSVACKFSLS